MGPQLLVLQVQVLRVGEGSRLLLGLRHLLPLRPAPADVRVRLFHQQGRVQTRSDVGNREKRRGIIFHVVCILQHALVLSADNVT